MTSADEYLAIVDAVAPGLVVGAHLVGSTVLDDFVPGVSDLDLVCELAGRPDSEALAAALPADVDVLFVSAGELEKPVTEALVGSTHTPRSSSRSASSPSGSSSTDSGFSRRVG